MEAADKHIYSIINSLSKSEKRYINIYLSNNYGDKLKQRLFNEICNKKRKEINDFEETITWTKNLTKLKYDLYSTILQQLEIYHSKNNNQIKLRRDLNQIQILYERKLFKACHKLINQSLKKAYLLEEHNIVIELQLIMLRTLTYSREQIKEQDIILSKIEEATKKMEIDYQFKKINAVFFSLMKVWGISEHIKPKITKLIHQPIFTKKNSLNSFISSYLYNNILCIYHQYLENNKKAYYYSKANMQLFLDNKLHIKNHTSEYISCINNHIISCNKLYYEDESEKCCELLKNVPVKREKEIIEIYQYYSTNRIASLVTFGKIKDAVAIEGYILTGQKKFKNRISPLFKTAINFNLASIFFLSKQLKKSLFYVNLILQSKAFGIRKDGLKMIVILNLLIHYELKNKNLSTSLFLSYKRNLPPKNKNYIEKWFLQFYQNLLNTKPDKNFFKLEEKKLLSNVSSEEVLLVELIDLFIWIRVKHEKDNLSSALIEYYKLGFKKYKKKRLRNLR